MKTMRFISVYFSLLLLIGFVTGCQPSSTPGSSEKSNAPGANTDDEIYVKLTPEALHDHPMQVTKIQEKIVSQELRTVGEIKADQNRVFHISSITPGRIVEDKVDLGQVIQAGQTLAVIQNPDLIKLQATSLHDLNVNQIAIEQAKTRLMLAKQNRDRESRLFKAGITPEKDWITANANLKIIDSELRGLQEHQGHIRAETKAMMASYGAKYTGLKQLRGGSQLIAPKRGVITRKNITLGDTVSPGQVLYELADLSQVWLDITVYPKDVNRLKPGYHVRFQSDSQPDTSITGRINYIRPDANQQSQTFVARAFLPNPSNILKPGMFGQVTVLHQELSRYLPFIPKRALQSYGKEFFVFIPEGKGTYRKQVIQVASRVDDGVFVKKGLEVGQAVVTDGAFILKSELLKNLQRSDEMDED